MVIESMRDSHDFSSLTRDAENKLRKLIQDAPFLKDFVFVGGSALAVHLKHRFSEDLDFFTHSTDFPLEEILSFCGEHKMTILNRSPSQIDAVWDGVKLTFFKAGWPLLKVSKPRQFNLASVDMLISMKVNTLFLRAKYRDYYDLYSISKSGISLKHMEHVSKGHIPGFSEKLFYMALTYTKDIEDDNIAHLQPMVTISKEEIALHFESAIRDSLK